MTFGGINNSYMSFYPQFNSGNLFVPFPNPLNVGALFSFATPRYSVFNNNFFGYTPPVNFCYMPQLDNPYDFLGKINFLPNNNSIFISQENTGGVFDFLNITRKNNQEKTTQTLFETPTVSYGYHKANLSKRRYSFNTGSNSVQHVNYNSQKGARLVEEINKIAKEGGFKGNCATSVKTAIANAGLGEYASGNAHELDQILSNNPNFKEIPANGVNLKNLPGGCILVYEKGVSGYNEKYGHCEIKRNDGTAGSDGMTHNIRSGAKIFVPV